MNTRIVREIVSILMLSRYYFDLSLKERHCLVKHILRTSSLRYDGKTSQAPPAREARTPSAPGVALS